MSTNVSDVIHARTGAKQTHTRFFILALILLLATVAYADRSILSISAPGIQQEFGLNAVQLGYILSAFSWAYVVGQLPGGVLLDRFGTKTIYTVALILWSSTTLLFGFVGGLTSSLLVGIILLFALRCLLGVTEAPTFPANGRIAAMWFPKQEHGIATALFASASYFAVAIFSPLAGWLVSRWGWPSPFFALGALGLVATVVWVTVMQAPRNHPRVSKPELDKMIEGGALVDLDTQHALQTRQPFSWRTLRFLLGNRMLWCAYLGQYCAIALSYFFITWFPTYLVQAHGMHVMEAGIATVVPAIGGFLGGISGGTISDMLIRRGWSVTWARKTPFIIGMAVGCSLVLTTLSHSNVLVVILVSLAFFGKGIAAGSGTWAIVSDTAPREAVGLAGAVFNCIGNVGGIVTPIVFGYLVLATGSYTLGLYFVAAHCLFGALLYLFVMGDIKRLELK
jgi:ACS family glucarate transporter-like MFS transporter